MCLCVCAGVCVCWCGSMQFLLWIDLCECYRNQVTDASEEWAFTLHPFPGSSPDTTNLFSISIVLSFGECYINGIIKYMTLWDWLSSLSLMPLRSIQITACINSSLLVIAEWYSLVECTRVWLFCLQFRAIKNKAAINIHLQMCVSISFHFSGVNTQEDNRW